MLFTKKQLWILILLITPLSLIAQIRLPSVIGHHMVLQQQSQVAIWGWDRLGETVTVTPSWSGEPVKTRAVSGGKWTVEILTPAAGGPFEIRIDGSNQVNLTDVWCGEVWVCSGQSNMEMPLAGWPQYNQPVTGSEQAIQSADYPQIRLFTVQRDTAYVPREDCQGEWVLCTPETVKDFSAVGYFFGRELYKRLKVPVGLIHTSWGGTPAEAWTSKAFIENIPYFHTSPGKTDAALFLQRKLDAYETVVDNWLDKLSLKPAGETPAWALPDYNDESWQEIQIPASWADTEVGSFEGMIKHRYKFKLPGRWANQKLVLELGPIDEMDNTWINGVRVGSHLRPSDWATTRTYEIPDGIIQKGWNTLAIQVANTSGVGGINGQPQQVRLYWKENPRHSKSLSGTWKVEKELAFDEVEPLPWCDNCAVPNTPTTLYNGMIYPIIPYGIKGAIWYQGESNRYDGELYKQIFPNMIHNWRQDWGLGDFPFYFVQIAPYTYRDDFSTGLLREAQYYTYLTVPNTGMVATMDIGSLQTIHPPDKQTVGFRLAQWAMAKQYGMKNLYYSGPMYQRMKKEDHKLRLFFSHICGGLTADEPELTCFTIAGNDQIFHPANARIEKNSVVVWSDKVPEPVAVRFGWESTDQPNLMNRARFPAVPFRTDEWEIED